MRRSSLVFLLVAAQTIRAPQPDRLRRVVEFCRRRSEEYPRILYPERKGRVLDRLGCARSHWSSTACGRAGTRQRVYPR